MWQYYTYSQSLEVDISVPYLYVGQKKKKKH